MNQKTTPTTEPSDRSTAFVPVEGGTETTSAELLLVIAYCVMWTLLLGFVLLSWKRLQGLGQRLGEIERSLGVSGGGKT